MRALFFLCWLLLWAASVRAADLDLDRECLNEAYPGLITATERDGEGRIWFLTSTGERLLYDDGIAKTPQEMLRNGDIEDAMRRPYPLEPARPDPALGGEPGRVRSYPLLRALYGTDRPSVERGLETGKLGASPVRLAAPAAAALRRVDAALSELEAEDGLTGLFSPVYGYFWRPIAKTDRLSPHSFGIAVDLNPKKCPYWQWSTLRPHPLQKTFSPALTAIFEENGFIWGGKWAHYDIMHFEYRPELIIKARKLHDRAAAGGTRTP